MYSRKHILQATFVLILAGMSASAYFLKPTDVRIAHYYESVSMYKEAMAAYEKSLKGIGDQAFAREILVRISILCRYIGDREKFLVTVKRLIELEYDDPELTRAGARVAGDFWRFDMTDRRKQDDVLLFARRSGNRNFVIDFLLGNQRVYEALSEYEEAYDSGVDLTEEEMKSAVRLARWTEDLQKRKKWLERAMGTASDAEMTRELFAVCIALGDNERALQLVSQVEPKTRDDFQALADFYDSIDDKQKAGEFYAKTEALCVQELALIQDKTSDESKKLMTELVYLYWKNGKLEAVVQTVETLCALGCKEPKLMDDALSASLHLWREKPDKPENQERVIRIARNMGKEAFVVDFLVQNRRFADALKIYEEQWRKGDLSADSLKVAVEIACCMDDRTLRKRWLERGAKALSVDWKNKGLMDAAFNAAMELWREDSDNRENQARVIRIAQNMGNQAFVANFLVWNKRYSDALKIYEARWRKGVLASDGLKKAVEISYWQNDRALQKKWFKRGIAESSDPELMRKLAYIYLDNQEYQSAKGLFSRLREMEPSNKEYLVTLAQICEMEKDYSTAYDIYRRVYFDTKEMTLLHGMVSCAYHLDSGIYEETLRELARQEPTEENLFRLASLYLYMTKDYKAANKALDKMVEKWPIPKYQLLLAYSLAQSGDNLAACDVLEQIPMEFQQPWGILLLSKHYQEKGKWNKAVDIVEGYIEIHPDNTDIVLSLAYIYKRLNWEEKYQKVIQSLLPPEAAKQVNE
jgi:tetratricopeptide (TPR) repeat protein